MAGSLGGGPVPVGCWLPAGEGHSGRDCQNPAQVAKAVCSAAQTVALRFVLESTHSQSDALVPEAQVSIAEYCAVQDGNMVLPLSQLATQVEGS